MNNSKFDSSLTPRVDSRDPLTRKLQIAIDAGYMRLAHAIVHPDSFEAIPRIIVRPLKRSGSVDVALLAAFALICFAIVLFGGIIGKLLAIAIN